MSDVQPLPLSFVSPQPAQGDVQGGAAIARLVRQVGLLQKGYGQLQSQISAGENATAAILEELKQLQQVPGRPMQGPFGASFLSDLDCRVRNLECDLPPNVRAIQSQLDSSSAAIEELRKALSELATKEWVEKIESTLKEAVAEVAQWKDWVCWHQRLHTLRISDSEDTGYTRALNACGVGSLTDLSKQKKNELHKGLKAYDAKAQIGRDFEAKDAEEMIDYAKGAVTAAAQKQP